MIYIEVSYNVSHFCLHLAYFSWPSSSSPAALSLSRAGSLYGVSGHSQRVLPVSHRLLTQRNCFAGETTWNYIIVLFYFTDYYGVLEENPSWNYQECVYLDLLVCFKKNSINVPMFAYYTSEFSDVTYLFINNHPDIYLVCIVCTY